MECEPLTGLLDRLRRRNQIGTECAQTHRFDLLAVRFARRNTLFCDEDVTDLPRLIFAVYVGMKATGDKPICTA